MTQALNYRPITPNDCDAVVALHRRAFDDEDIGASVFLSPLVGNYLRQIIAFPHYQVEHSLSGVWQDEILIGYFWGRALEKSWHLNYFAVAPEHRGQGIGRALYEKWHEIGSERGYREYSLDVAQAGHVLRAWYHRLGWQETARTWFYRRALQTIADPSAIDPSRNDLRDLEVRGWEAAEAWQSSYGFSQFEVADAKKAWRIGRLAERYFRASEPLPPAVENLLWNLDSSRTLLLATPHPLSEKSWPETARKVSLRLQYSD